MPNYTDNHGYQIFEEGEKPWHHGPDFRALETDVEIRDTDAARSDYEPKDGAKYYATDTKQVYLGVDGAWEQVPSSGANPSFGDVDAARVQISDTPTADTDAVRKTETDAIESDVSTLQAEKADLDGAGSAELTNYAAVETETESNVIKAHELPGDSLDQQLSEALSRITAGGVIEVEPISGDHSWDSEITIDITEFDGLTLDFRRATISSTVANPLIISGAGSTNFGGGGTHIIGGEWSMPDTGDAAVTIRDSLRVSVYRTTSTGDHTATVAVENIDYYCEGIRLDELMAGGGAATYDWRPASVTGGTGTDSFIHAVVGTGRGVTCSGPSDFGFRLRGSFLSSDFGMHRVSYPEGTTGVRAFVIDAEMGSSPIGPLHAEQGDTGVNTFLETGSSYQPPAYYRGFRNVENNDIVRSGGSSDPIPVIESNTSGFRIRDAGTGASIRSNESVPELLLDDYNRTRLDEEWLMKGSGRVARWFSDAGDNFRWYMGGDGSLRLRNDSNNSDVFTFFPGGRTEAADEWQVPIRSADPSSPNDGDIWYRSDNHEYRGVENGAVVTFDTTVV